MHFQMCGNFWMDPSLKTVSKLQISLFRGFKMDPISELERIDDHIELETVIDKTFFNIP